MRDKLLKVGAAISAVIWLLLCTASEQTVASGLLVFLFMALMIFSLRRLNSEEKKK